MDKVNQVDPALKIIDPDQRDWMYDGAGNKVYKDMYTKAWRSVEELEKDLDMYRKGFEAANRILKHLIPEHSGAYFICGEAGNKDRNGIPETIYICTALGSDVVTRFAKQ